MSSRKVQGRLRKLTIIDRRKKSERNDRRGREIVFTSKGAFNVKKIAKEDS